ncbi:MAG TPA: HTTM domain-containing protein [Rhodopirellula baltica]|uniref:HTTM-like domain-containing protein n=1 Tax=Rhodopirellula baltica (strain DSM 10527 / NCIMB 13988 / SH1) TaxID=243090 RepID=Q7UWK8_RHOBA|nr:HTTM domain-containing protein [Rhodopirellula baltica]CAD72355.1 conserved hypothetical protein [Rhodopirellula baltica SH 1]HBE66057.1 HTTM domain-containing protein [Rhodopirellula baltica]
MMIESFKQYAASWVDAWDRFWFTPRHIDTLAVLRIVTGAMLLYSHLVLATDFASFIGTEAWIDNETSARLHDGTLGEQTAAWSYLWLVDNATVLWLNHIATILVTACFMVGFLTRVTGPLTWFLQLMVIHRLLGSLFGLDQIVTYCAMYVAFTPCGAVWSIDAKLRRRFTDDGEKTLTGLKAWLFPADKKTITANVATRLLQIHLCVIYLFGGIAKARGELWWDGTAVWFAVANYEYQSLDMTFLGRFPRVFTALSHITMFWEIFYCAIIWPRLTRGITLALAVAVHGGIALFLGMMTFGIMMIGANGIFVSPDWIRRKRLGDLAEDESDDASLSGVMTSLGGDPNGGSKSVQLPADLQHRLEELEAAEKGIQKRYAKLKRREAKNEERTERLMATREKIKQKLADGSLSAGDSVLRNDDLNES